MTENLRGLHDCRGVQVVGVDRFRCDRSASVAHIQEQTAESQHLTVEAPHGTTGVFPLLYF